MATTKTMILEWLDQAPKGTTHVIIATDTFDWEDYPVYVAKDMDVKAEVSRYSTNPMSKVMEVYDLRLPLEEQLKERRAWHL